MLDVYLGAVLVGHLEQASPNRIRLRYTADAITNGLALSVALPARSDPYENDEAVPFFEGLLPEGAALRTISRALGISPHNVFSALEQIGRDCGGAVTIVPHGRPPTRDAATRARPLDDEALATLIADLPARPLGIAPDDDVRLSLAGAQDKLVLRKQADGTLALPLDGAPSTHILKPDPGIGGMDDMVVNEAFCLAVCRRAGLPTASAEIVTVGGRTALLVERFDRLVDPETGAITRLHQEDACQALGIPSEAKYQAEGGPGPAAIVVLLTRATRPSAPNVLGFLDQLVTRYVLGDHDGHGKNIALLSTPTGRRLAPIYDVVATAAYRSLSPKMAMNIGGEYRGDYVESRHWERLSAELTLGAAGFRTRRHTLAAALLAAAHAEHAAFRAAGVTAEVIDRIVAIVDRRVTRV